MTHGFWFLTCDGLATYRLATLVSRDYITWPIRQAILRRSESAFQFVSCQWCTSIWLAAGVVALTRFWPSGWQYGAMALALSGVAGFLAER